MTSTQKIFKKFNWFSLLKESHIQFNMKKSDISLFLLLIGIIIFIMWMFNTFGWWAPYGDYEAHSYYTSMQQVNGKLTFQYPFLSDLEITYPLGIHLFSANLSNLYNITPAETVLMINGITVFLLIGILMSIVYSLTKSFWLVLIVIIFIFNINHADLTGNGSIWGGLAIGTIPNLAGFLSLFVLILVLLIREDSRLFPIFLLLMIIASTIVYPLSPVYSILVLGIYLISKIPIKNMRKEISKKVGRLFTKFDKRKLVNLNCIFLVIIAIGSLEGSLFEHTKTILNNVVSHPSEFVRLYSQTGSYYVEDVFFPSIIIGILSSLYITIYLKRYRFVGILTLSFILIQISDLDFFEIIFSQRRYFHIIPIFSWIVLSIVVYSIWKKNGIKVKQSIILDYINRKKDETISNSGIFNSLMNSVKTKSFRNYIVLLSFAILTLMFVIPDVSMIAENGTPTIFKRTADALPYLAGMNWIEKNVNPDDRVLSFVDPDHYSIQNHPHGRYFVWLEGMKYQFVVNGWLDFLFLDEGEKIKINKAFSNFRFVGMLEQVLKQNEIKYIITTYEAKRHEIFQTYDFLDVVSKDDYTTVYKVLPELISTEEESIKKDLATIAFSGDYKAATRLYNQIVEFDSKAFSDTWEGKNTILIKLGDDNEGKIIFQRLYEFEIEEIFAYEIFSEFVLSGIMHQALIKNEVTYVITSTDDIRHKIFQTYDFLDVVSKDDYTTVYKVLPELISTEEESIKKDLLVAKILELEGRPQLALKGYEKIRKFDSTSFEAWSNEIRLSNMLNDYDQTKSIYDEMINEFLFLRNLHSQDLEKYRLYTSQYYDALEGKARLAIKFSEYRDALRAYEEIAFDQRHFDVDLLIQKGQVLELMEEFIKAKDIYEDILSREPENSLARERIKNIDEYLIQK